MSLEAVWALIREDPRPEALRAYFRWAAHDRAARLAAHWRRVEAGRHPSPEIPGGLERLPGWRGLWHGYLGAVRAEIRRQRRSWDEWAAHNDLLAHAAEGLVGNHDPLGGWRPNFDARQVLVWQRRTYEAAGQRALNELRRLDAARRASLGAGGEFAIDDPRLRERVDQLALDQVKGIDVTTAEELRRIMGEGGTVAEMGQAISDYWDQADLVRGITIASTEMARAAALAELDTYRENGVETVEFSGGPSDDECDEYVGEQYPADSFEAMSLIPVHPRCTHYWAPVVAAGWNLPTAPWAGGSFDPLDLGGMEPEEIADYVANLPGYVSGEPEPPPPPPAEPEKAAKVWPALPKDPGKAAKELYQRATQVTADLMGAEKSYASGVVRLTRSNRWAGLFNPVGPDAGRISFDRSYVDEPLRKWLALDPAARARFDEEYRTLVFGSREDAEAEARARGVEPHPREGRGLDPREGRVWQDRGTGDWYAYLPTSPDERANRALETVLHENIHAIGPDLSPQVLRTGWGQYGMFSGRNSEEGFTEAAARMHVADLARAIGLEGPAFDLNADLEGAYSELVRAARELAHELVSTGMVPQLTEREFLDFAARQTIANRDDAIARLIAERAGFTADALKAKYGMGPINADGYASHVVMELRRAWTNWASVRAGVWAGRRIADAFREVLANATAEIERTWSARFAFPSWWPPRTRGVAAQMGAQGGIFAGFWLEPAAAAALAVPGGEPAPELHLTLAYLGKATDESWSPVKGPAMLLRAAQAFCRAHPPLEGRVAGLGRFTPPEGPHPAVALFDSPALPAFRQDLVAAFAELGLDVDATHGFIPHVTLAYVQPGEPSPAAPPPVQLRFDRLTVAVGASRVELPLQGATE